jgi:hypothetical protein
MTPEVRDCAQCGAQFKPRREHARFCSAVCRITWNRQPASGQPVADTPLSWSVSALADTAERLCKAGNMNLPEALALVSEAVWWVTLVDATMIRYHHDAYDRALGTAWATTWTSRTSSSRSTTASAATPPSLPGRGDRRPSRCRACCRNGQGGPQPGKTAGTCITVPILPAGLSARPSTGPPDTLSSWPPHPGPEALQPRRRSRAQLEQTGRAGGKGATAAVPVSSVMSSGRCHA